MMDIRALTPQDDLAVVGQIYAESWKDCYRGLLPQNFLNKLTPERWTAVIAAAPQRTAVLRFRGQPVGAATVGFCRDREREGYGEIISLYLLPQAKGMGLGRRLLEAALETLRQEGCEESCLWVLAGNEYAIHFYEHMGFVRTGARQQERYASESVELIEMTRSLIQTASGLTNDTIS